MEILTQFVIRLISALAIFVLQFSLASIPFVWLYQKIRKNREESNDWQMRTKHKQSETSLRPFLSLTNCFAGGIFLATCFFGLVPNVRRNELLLKKMLTSENSDPLLSSINITSENENFTSKSSDEFTTSGKIELTLQGQPLTEITLIFGFLFIVIMEQLVVCVQKLSHNQERGSKRRKIPKGSTSQNYHTAAADVEMEFLNWKETLQRKRINRDDMREQRDNETKITINQNSGTTSAGAVGSLLLLFGLSTHSIIEGVALGVQTNTLDFFRLVFVVMLHEVFCAMAFGLSLAQELNTLKRGFMAIACLSACIPLGVLLGSLVPSDNRSIFSLSLRLLLEGMAAGTFVYVSCVEMLGGEMAHGGVNEPNHNHDGEHEANAKSKPSGMAKALCMVLGIVAFVVLYYLSVFLA